MGCSVTNETCILCLLPEDQHHHGKGDEMFVRARSHGGPQQDPSRCNRATTLVELTVAMGTFTRLAQVQTCPHSSMEYKGRDWELPTLAEEL